MKVEWGSQVWLEYEAFLDSGRQIDRGLLGVCVGREATLPGLGAKLLGLQEGEERLIRLSPGEAFGEWDLRAVLVIQRAALPGTESLEDGTTLEIETKDGSRARCRLYRLPGEEDQVSLDFNHPLAGESLTLFVHVAAVGPPGWGARLRTRRQRRASGQRSWRPSGEPPDPGPRS